LPVCPSNKLVMYKKNFTPAEVVSLSNYIRSQIYEEFVRAETSYYVAYKLASLLDEPDSKRFDLLLKASWQAENTDKYDRYAREALLFLQKISNREGAQKEKMWPTYQMLIGELQRRLGLFDESLLQFQVIAGHEALQSAVFRDAISFEIELIEKKDRAPQKRPKTKNAG
jgi:hypothetical protein